MNTSDQIIKLAIMAVGGQGGGVMANWVETTARACGYAVQATSVAGVAQRTGATIYYLEMAPQQGRMQVFSQAPSAGDVDILVAAEWMEAGRAILRGFVTPDRTTLIASTHRALAVSEKSVPGDGIANAGEVSAAAEIAARQLIMFDMEETALSVGSVISASLFGALAGSGALPFPRDAFEQAIQVSGKGVEKSLLAFDCGFAKALQEEAEQEATNLAPQLHPRGPAHMVVEWQNLAAELEILPASLREILMAGLRKTVDFQDISYGREYLARIKAVLQHDTAARDYLLTQEAAKHIANAMAYDDLIRVAGLKTRAARFVRIEAEMKPGADNLMKVTEFMHPRAAEIVGLLPAGFGQKCSENPKTMARIDRLFNKARRLRSNGLFAFLQLYTLGGMRKWRLRSFRHAMEVEHMNRWLETALGHAEKRYDLAVELIRCRRLIKGYSDTHSRGQSKFDKVLEGINLVAERKDAADWAKRLRDAALQDEKSEALDGALKTLRSFA
ncbi:MAG: indolepyruvate oxidoreductase subunit beta family protein [Rhodobacteraceae bacterium]|nr:indolepyruvate oxidoreductase subunit beta family protein [Paracoccaceae bacterium]